MVSHIRKVPSFDLAVFGGTGDLAHRKLFPALFHRFLDAQFSPPTKIIGVSRRPMDHAAYRVTIAHALKQFAAALNLPADYVDFLAGQLPDDLRSDNYARDKVQAAFHAFCRSLRCDGSPR